MPMRLAILAMLVFSSCSRAAVKQSDVDRMAARWQHVLKLADWDGVVRFVKVADLPGGTAGFSSRDKASRVGYRAHVIASCASKRHTP